MKVPHLKMKLISTLLIAVFSALSAANYLYYIDHVAGDYLYQRPAGGDERIAVIGIDSYALEELGPWPWGRDVIADCLSILNSDPETRPAAIGVDIIFEGETDPWSDDWLAEAADADNIAVSCGVEFDSEVVFADDGQASFNSFGVKGSALPFPALRERTAYGHTNAMYDADGVLRHHLWSVETEDGEQIGSLPGILYRMFCDYWEIEADFQPELSENGFWWLDYSASPGDYYAYSVCDILYGDYDPDQLSGSVVLIGPYDSGLTDKFLTAADRAENMYGVEYLANVVNAMFRGAEKREVSSAAQLWLLAGATFLSGLLAWFLKLRWAAVAAVLEVSVSWLGAYGLYQSGYVVHPLWLPFGIFMEFLSAIIGHYVISNREKRQIQRIFERYEDPAVIRELMKTGITDADLNGKLTDVAVLFVDIRGFTTLSEKMQPETIVAILNEYLTLTSRAVMQCGGTLDKFIGDCTMAFWGAPLPCEDKEYQACRAAMQMAQGATGLADRIREQYGCDVYFGIGVHTGPAVIGNIGSPERKDYTAIGDTVNTASRLESNAPPGTIYISRAVADALGQRAQVTPLETPIKLKGKAEGFEILTLDRLF